MKKLTFFLCVPALICGCASAPVSRSDTPAMEKLGGRLSSFIQEGMEREGIPGLSIAVYTPDLGSWTAGFGNTAGWGARPVTPRTGFCTGSISKSFTAAGILLLAGEGKLDLDKPLRTWLPDFSVKSRFSGASEITPRHLLTHTSGLPADWNNDKFSGDTAAFRQVTEYMKEQYLQFPPGERTSYCNLGYALLGVLTERVSGQDFYTFQRDRILGPLGMSFSDFDKGMIPPESRALGQLPGWAFDEPTVSDAPAGSLWSNAEDFLRFFRALDRNFQSQDAGEPFSGADQAAMRAAAPEVSLLDGRRALGMGVFPSGQPWGSAHPVVSHAGGTMTFNALYVWIPEERVGVALLGNRTSGFKEAAALRILQEVRTLRGTAPGKKAPEPVPPSGLIPEPGVKSFSLKEGLLRVDFSTQEPAWSLEGPAPDRGSLIWQGDTALMKSRSGTVREKLKFLQAGGRLHVLRVIRTSSAGFEPRGPEVSEPAQVPEAWKNLEGTWEITNIVPLAGVPLPSWKVDVQVRLAGPLVQLTLPPALVLGSSSPVEHLFLPVSPAEAVKTGSGDRDAGATLFYSDGEGELKYLGWVLKRK